MNVVWCQVSVGYVWCFGDGFVEVIEQCSDGLYYVFGDFVYGFQYFFVVVYWFVQCSKSVQFDWFDLYMNLCLVGDVGVMVDYLVELG